MESKLRSGVDEVLESISRGREPIMMSEEETASVFASINEQMAEDVADCRRREIKSEVAASQVLLGM
jgi:hypothetical protein